MAEFVFGLAKSAVEGTVTMVKTAMEEEEKLQKDARRNLMLISDEFEMMHSFLNVSKDHATDDDVTRTLVRQVRNMALHVEDCIEPLVGHLDGGKSNWWRRLLPSCVPAAAAAPGAADLDAAIADIELLKVRMEAMGQRNLRYGRIGDSGPKKPATEQTHQQPMANKTASGILMMAVKKKQSRRVELVGLINKKVKEMGNELEAEHEEEVESTLHYSSSSSSSPVSALQVISVLGTAGTMSIIKKAYDDPEICRSFRCRAWVKLMHPFSAQEFVRSLLVQFYKNGCPPMDLKLMSGDACLIEEFRKQMSSLKYLVVLEDVSSMVDWESARACLADDNNRSCIVVNTHQVEVATLCVGYPHRVLELEKLSADQSAYVVFKENEAAKDEETMAVNKLKTASEWLDKHQLVGRDMDLIHSVGAGSVVSVWGMSGVGKSFLVKHVYCRLLQTSYGLRYTCGWVNVPHPFDLGDLSWRLLLSLNPEYLQHHMIPAIKDPIQACREYLHEHYYFIVIDGLRSTEEWDLTKAALGFGTLGNDCIIVITNEESVAKHCASDINLVWNVKGLEVDHAIELFEKKAQWGTEMLHINEEERRTIMHKCGGLPKVIHAVAAVSNLYDGYLWYPLRKDNLVSMLADNAALIKENIEGLFAWLHSYFRSCPDFLKPCIFYLTIFPLNHTIRRRRLVRRWIAEGYARDEKEITAEENGEMSFSKLVNLSMILVKGKATFPRTPLCQINGFLREYVVSQSMEENLVFALEGYCSKNSRRAGRHLAIGKSWHRDINVFESIDFSLLRSLTVFGEWKPFFISEKMRLLRVLDLEDESSGSVTNGDVEQMVKLLPRLKFLSLRRCKEITHLPDSMGDLKQLQTLDIRGTSVIRLPKSIIKIEKLQYIRAGTSIVPVGDDANSLAENPSTSAAPKNNPHATMVPWLSKLSKHHRTDDGSCNAGVNVPRGTGKLSNLHTLGVVDIGAAGNERVLEELKNLTQLHKLGVSGINRNNSHRFFSTISGLYHLESLSLQVQLDEDNNQAVFLNGISDRTIDNLLSLKLYGLVRTLPVWTKELQNLRKLSLQMTMMPHEGIEVLRGLDELRSLRLSLSEFQDDQLVCRFSLDFLEISCNSRLQATITFDGYLRSSIVRVLRIRCWRVSSLRTSGLQHVGNLKEVWLSGPCDDAHRQHFESELAKYPEERGKPVLRLEEPGSSMPWLMTSS